MKKHLFEKSLFITMLIMWFVPFLLIYLNVAYTIVESIFLILLASIICLQLIFMEDSYYSLAIILFIPFIFAHPFDAYSIPISLFIAAIIAMIGMIIHLVKYKVTIKFHKLTKGFLLLALALIFGGINTNENYILSQIMITLFACFGLIFVILFFTSTIKNINFGKVCNLIILFSLFIQLQGFIALPFNANFDFNSINGRNVNVGWGICNNIDLILSTTIPFSLYFIFKNKVFNKNFILALIYPLVILSSIILFKSKGCIIFSSILTSICYFLVLFYFYKSNQKELFKKSFISIGIYIASFIVILAFASIFVPILDNFKNTFNSFNVGTLNGRIQIYIDSFNALKGNYILGKGIFAGFNVTIDETTFTWCHSTIIQVLYSCGIIGLLLFLFHIFEKYYYLIKNCSIEKIILLIAFMISGLYGLIDVSYFFINYMVLYIVITILCNFVYEDTSFKLVEQLKNN